MKSAKLTSLAIAMLICVLTYGQEKSITGIVTDATGPIFGANVIVKGTHRGTQTDANGKYSIHAKKGETLIYSFIGMKDQSIIIGNSNVINVKLKSGSLELEAVVVTAMGIKKEKKSLGYAVQSLNGKVAGISVGASKDKIVIRGNSSLSDKKAEYDDDEKSNLVKQTQFFKTDPNQEDYNTFIENVFESPRTSPLSTFSIDVDNASYTNIRRFINNGQKVPQDAVCVEEMVNFFKYKYPQPQDENPFSINTEYSDCPWNLNNKLVRIGLQGKNIETDNLPASNLVF
jgi:Ca-activated chloride channel homolog